MIGIGLKLLGIGKFFKDFFVSNWRWLLPVLFVVCGFLWTKEHYYDLGKETERAAWEARVAKEQEQNNKITLELLDAADHFGRKYIEESEARRVIENTHTESIKTIIKDNPVYTDCKVDQEVLDQQNALKELGPK